MSRLRCRKELALACILIVPLVGLVTLAATGPSDPAWSDRSHEATDDDRLALADIGLTAQCAGPVTVEPRRFLIGMVAAAAVQIGQQVARSAFAPRPPPSV